MFLLRYLKPINGLPDLRGSLSMMSREAIAAANRPEGAKYHKKKTQKTWPIQEVTITAFCYRKVQLSAWSSCRYVITPHTRLFLKLLQLFGAR